MCHVHTIISEKQNPQICPKCGSAMILRETKKGVNKGKQFWGCSTFPECRTVNSVIQLDISQTII